MLIGIEIGGTKLQVVAGTTQRGIVRRWRGKVQPQLGGQEIRQQIAKAVESMRMDEPDVASIGWDSDWSSHPPAWRTTRWPPRELAST